MRIILLAAASMSLASCSGAVAATPDSNNPAHCLAAFNYDAYWFRVGHEPEKVAEYLARGLYLLAKVKSAGGSPASVLAESKQFSREHVKNDKEMDALSLACGMALAHDAQFRAEFAGYVDQARPLVSGYQTLTAGVGTPTR